MSAQEGERGCGRISPIRRRGRPTGANCAAWRGAGGRSASSLILGGVGAQFYLRGGRDRRRARPGGRAGARSSPAGSSSSRVIVYRTRYHKARMAEEPAAPMKRQLQLARRFGRRRRLRSGWTSVRPSRRMPCSAGSRVRSRAQPMSRNSSRPATARSRLRARVTDAEILIFDLERHRAAGDRLLRDPAPDRLADPVELGDQSAPRRSDPRGRCPRRRSTSTGRLGLTWRWQMPRARL